MMRIFKLLVLVLPLVLTFCAQQSFATDDDVTEDEKGNLPAGYVRSGNAFNSMGHTEANSFSLQAEYATEQGQYDQAIKLCQKAIEKNDDDADVHLAYADALQHKLKRQKEKDPNLFIAAVREWLIVMRNEKGDERGITNAAGLSIPGVQHLYADEDRSKLAQQRIISLVGYVPKARETDQMFLKRVAKQCEGSVKGTVLKQADSN
jgi:tetratricopeptide (TPR) repeat protein